MRLCCFALLLACAWPMSRIHAQEHPLKSETPRRVCELSNDLARPLAAAPFQQSVPLTEALQTLRQAFRERYGKDLPLVIDQRAFKEEDADAPEMSEVQVKLDPLHQQRSTIQILRALISQVPTANATLFVKPGVIEITTRGRMIPRRLLRETVDLRFERQPLSFVLEEIYDQTGVYVVLDPRVGLRPHADHAALHERPDAGGRPQPLRRNGQPEAGDQRQRHRHHDAGCSPGAVV